MNKIKNNQDTSIIVITDSNEKEVINQKFNKSTIITMPSFENNEELVDYLLNINELNEELLPIVASKSKTLLSLSKALGLNTCFLNNGFNDTTDFSATYEIPVSKKVLKK